MSVRCSFSQGVRWKPDTTLLLRIKTAYRQSITHYQQPNDTMWASIAEKRQNIHAALLSDDDDVLSDLLANPAKTELFFGMDTVVGHLVDSITASEPSRIHVLEAVKSHFIEMAETIGATRAWYFEAKPNRDELTDVTVENILNGIDKIIGVRLPYPNPFENEFGINTSRGIIVPRTPMAIYQAHRLQTVADLVGGRKVLEIGPGNGRCAFYAHAMGFDDYTTIDLPMGVVGQACFLAATLGPDKIWMLGDDASLQRGRIRLLPPFALSSEDFDIVLNVDSLTEMARDQSVDYLKFAANRSKAILSINHELNTYTVRELAEMADLMTRPIRSSMTIRRGYIEELFLLPNRSR
jgi:hypothetical protein